MIAVRHLGQPCLVQRTGIDTDWELVARSTCQASAASAIVASWRTSCRKTCDGHKKRLVRHPARSVPCSGSGMVTLSSTNHGDLWILTGRSPDRYANSSPTSHQPFDWIIPAAKCAVTGPPLLLAVNCRVGCIIRFMCVTSDR